MARYSVEVTDPGYQAYTHLTLAGKRIVCFLDGVKMEHVITIDEEAGEVVQYADGWGVNGAGDVKRETLRGKVECHLDMDAVPAALDYAERRWSDGYTKGVLDERARRGTLTMAVRPPIPSSVYWLGDREDAEQTRHAMDMRGCVLYFERQSDCLVFMRSLEALGQTVRE